MRIIAIVCLVIGILGGVKAVTGKKPVRGSEAYRTGYAAGKITVPLIFIPLGLFLLLRKRNPSKVPPTITQHTPLSSPPRPGPAPVTGPIPIKIQCACGQSYAFDVEPVGGQMPAPVVCPVCGTDGTSAANAVIVQTLAARTQPLSPQKSAGTASGFKMRPFLIAGAAVGIVLLLLIGSVAFRSFNSRNRARQAHEEMMRRPASPPVAGSTFPGGPPAQAVPSSRPGSARPVPPTVTSVEVLWHGRWWPATIVRRENIRALVRYEGSVEDQWVTPDRLRPREP